MLRVNGVLGRQYGACRQSRGTVGREPRKKTVFSSLTRNWFRGMIYICLELGLGVRGQNNADRA